MTRTVQDEFAEIIRDSERFKWLCSGKKTRSKSLVQYEIDIISGEKHNLDAYRAAVDDAMKHEVKEKN